MLTADLVSNIAQQHGLISANKSRGEAVASIMFAVAEYNLGAGGIGWLNGRFAAEGHDHMRIAGVPVDAAAGAAGVLGALFGVFGALDTHVAAVAAGALGAFSYRNAFAMGAKARVEMEEGKKVLSSGQARGELSSGGSSNVVSIDEAKVAAR